jgi:pyruvate dehydrogenase E2 component (dihydrolipoamide acetyltransferase)
VPTEFTLPELGENVEKGDVVRVLISAGDIVKADQPVLELETDKATIEVPSTVSGKVSEIRVKPGDKVKVGQVVFVVDGAAVGVAPATAAKEAQPQALPPEPPAAPKPAKDAAGRKSAAPSVDDRRAPVVDISAGRPAPAAAASAAAVRTVPDRDEVVAAAPSVRRYARELGVRIGDVAGSGPAGRIGQEDVKQHVKALLESDAEGAGGGGAPAVARRPALPDFTKWGEIDVKPMSSIRRKTAQHLSIAWQAPHVTQHDRADVTALEEFRRTYGPRVEKAGGKLTVTAIAIKIVTAALDRFPQFASSLDLAREAIVFKKYRHIGVAVDTPNGLLVPVIRDADRKTITEVAVELATLSQKARDRKLTLDEMAGSVFSMTNLGGIGGTAFTPIINQPEVAILGISRTSTEPVWKEGPATSSGAGQFVPRQVLPLSLSYDHRVIDGADAARFLRFVAEGLEQPLTLQL